MNEEDTNKLIAKGIDFARKELTDWLNNSAMWNKITPGQRYVDQVEVKQEIAKAMQKEFDLASANFYEINKADFKIERDKAVKEILDLDQSLHRRVNSIVNIVERLLKW